MPTTTSIGSATFTSQILSIKKESVLVVNTATKESHHFTPEQAAFIKSLFNQPMVYSETCHHLSQLDNDGRFIYCGLSDNLPELTLCSEIKDCHFKQLQRATQQIKKLETSLYQ